MSASTRVDAAPFLKWPGGKRSILPRIFRHIPERFRNYYEPFVGGGAVFFRLETHLRCDGRAYLGDVNKELVETYQVVRDDVEGLVRALRRHARKHSEAHFYDVRARVERDAVARAARMVYLNKTCFNGLYRVNKKGEFNAPFGRYDNPRILDEDRLRACALALRNVRMKAGDFAQTVRTAREGDVVYFDPPYMPRVGMEFVAYAAGGFSLEDHVRLRDTAQSLVARGVCVIVSNSDTEEVRRMYDGFQFEEVSVQRSIGADGFRRMRAPDLLIY